MQARAWSVKRLSAEFSADYPTAVPNFATPSPVTSPKTLFELRQGDPWLVGMDSERFWLLCQDRRQTLQADQPRDVLLVTADPVEVVS